MDSSMPDLENVEVEVASVCLPGLLSTLCNSRMVWTAFWLLKDYSFSFGHEGRTLDESFFSSFVKSGPDIVQPRV